MTPIDGVRAAVLHQACTLAMDAVRKQLDIKKADLFRTAALKSLLGALAAERSKLETEFPTLVEQDGG